MSRATRISCAPSVGQGWRAALLLGALVLLSGPAPAQEGTIEEIIPQGLGRMSREAFLHALGLQVGDPYDEARIRERFRALWALGLFEDVTMEAERGPAGGRVLIVKVRERPVLTSVTYEDNSVVTRTAIEDRLRERHIALQLGKPIDRGAVFFAESAIRDLLSEKGYLSAEVKAQENTVTETSRAVHFSIVPGGKTRIRKIDFVGNQVFSDSKLKGALKLTAPRKWYWPFSSKNLYHPAKWDQDVGGLRDLYQSRGYLDVEIRAPVVDVLHKEEKPPQKPEGVPAPQQVSPPPTSPEERKRAERRERKALEQARQQERKAKKVKTWVELTVPIVEGRPYRLGQVTITGAQVIPQPVIRAMFPLPTGAVLDNERLDQAMERITRQYEDRGHLYARAVRRIERHPNEGIADVEIQIEEDKPYFVGRVDFTGNATTRDKVLRRELLIAEGDLFSRTALDVSKAKVNQLGYFEVRQDPVVQPIEGENRVNVTFAGVEAGRNEIQVGGGYSGVDGAFFNGVYSTRNFLGRGQILSLALQIGGRSDRFQISFQEPWFLNRPYRLGASVFRQDVDYGSTLRSTSTGLSTLLGKRLGRYGSVDLTYRWQDVSSRSVLVGGIEPTTITTQTTVSSVTPVFGFSTINNPYRPNRGRSFNSSLQIAGGPLGGETSFVKPILSFTGYRRTFGRGFLALHAQGGLVREWAGGSGLSGSNIEGVPRFERFWLGGDTLGPRVFETRSITPLRYVELQDVDDNGDGTPDRQIISDVLGDPRFVSADDLVTSGGIPVLVEIGGDRYFLFQAEYVLPLNEQVEIAAFFDAGDALAEDQSLGFDTLRASAGVELRFHLPIFPVPLRLIYGIPVRELETDRSSNFTFSIGRSF